MRPFSNGSEFDYWLADNCGRGRGCIHDGYLGGAEDQSVACPLIDMAYDDRWPKEWPVVEKIWPGRCEKFEETV